MQLFKAFAIVTCTLAGSNVAAAKPPQFFAIYDFARTQESNNPAPSGPLAIDSVGALYGSNFGGGLSSCTYGCGTIYRYQQATASYTTLYSFTGQSDGYAPESGLVLGKDGQLYGMTELGGNQSCEDGCGTLFRIDSATGSLTTLFNFYAAIGGNPNSPLAVDKRGVFYGATPEYGTVAGGNGGYGTLFSYNPATRDFTTLYTFGSLPHGADGETPYGTLAIGRTGLLYGVTLGGGANGYGTIFVLNPDTKILKTLYSFSNTVGYGLGGLVIDKNGNLYGTTYGSGAVYCKANCGTIFRLDSTTGALSILHTFTGTDGAAPAFGVALSKAGLLFGSTTEGGAYCNGGCGTLFRYNIEKQEFTLLLSLNDVDDGPAYPGSPLSVDANGTFYGTTNGGGLPCPYGGCGTIFEFSP